MGPAAVFQMSLEWEIVGIPWSDCWRRPWDAVLVDGSGTKAEPLRASGALRRVRSGTGVTWRHEARRVTP